MSDQQNDPDGETHREADEGSTPEEVKADAAETAPAGEADPTTETSVHDMTETETGGPKPSDETAPAGWYQDPTTPGQQRYWDGSAWSDQTTASNVPISTTRRSADERKVILAQQVQQAVSRGLRIESQSNFQAVLIEGKPVNHTLHAILTIFTCLLWGIIWAVVAGTGGEKREMIVIDEFGNVQHQKLGKA